MFTLLELTPGSFVPDAQSILEFLAPESRLPFNQALAQEMERGKGADIELVMVTGRGRRFWARMASSVQLDAGRVVHRSVILRDVTLEKTAQQAQRQAWMLQRRTSARLELALQGAQLAIWGFDTACGRVLHAQRWDMFGYERVPATVEGFRELVHPDDLAARTASLEACLSGRSLQDDVEYRLRKPCGSWVWVRARGQLVAAPLHGEAAQYAGVVMDVSAQVAARSVVQDQTRFLQAMVEGFDTGVIVSDQRRIVFANDCLHRLLGHSPAERLEGQDESIFFSNADLAVEHERRAALAQGVAVPTAVFELRTRAGGFQRAAVNTSRVTWNGRPHHILTVSALSEHSLLEAQIRETQVRFERVLISELEAQQSHIARELHDSLGSELAGLSLIVGSARSAAEPVYPLLAKHLDGALCQVKTAVEMTRALARGLTPVSEVPGGLRRALEQLARDYTQTKGVHCEVHSSPQVDDLSVETGNHIYRIVQEALTNAIRHGRARDLRVHLSRRGEKTYRLSVLDDGCGFDPSVVSQHQVGLGIRSMLARARIVDGRLRFRRKACGMEVSVHWQERAAGSGH